MQAHKKQMMTKGGSAILGRSSATRGGLAAAAAMLFAALVMCLGSWTGLAYAEDDPVADTAYFTVYHQKSNGTPEVVKEYTQEEFEALKSNSSDPVSGQYYKGGAWNVWTTTEYVTLEDLFDDAGLGNLYAANSGASVTYGAKDGSTQAHDVSKLLSNSKFFPNAGAESETDASGSYSVPAVLALTGASSAVTSTSKAAEDTNLAAIAEGSTSTKPMPTMIFGTTDEAFAAKTSPGVQFWNGLTSITITDPCFTLTFQGNDGTLKAAKRYSKNELEALKSNSSDPVSGMHYKSGWRVWTATEYVTLEDLFADAGLSDEYVDGASIAYEGKGATQMHAVSKLLNDSWFYPNTEAENTNTEDAKRVPAVLALKYATSAVSTTAADAEAANVENASTNSTPVMVFGTTQEAYDDTTKSSGMQFWVNLTSLALIEKPAPVVVAPAKQTVSTSKSSYSLVYGKSASLGAKAKTALSYKSSNAKVASVSSTGKVTAKGVGTAKITVSAKATGSYAAASRTVTVKVSPKGVASAKAKGAKKSLKVSWKKSSKSNADGYQVRWSSSKKMSKAKYAKLKSYKYGSKTVKRLKAKKTYYVQVRVYNKVGGKYYYSAWSSVKKAKTK